MQGAAKDLIYMQTFEVIAEPRRCHPREGGDPGKRLVKRLFLWIKNKILTLVLFWQTWKKFFCFKGLLDPRLRGDDKHWNFAIGSFARIYPAFEFTQQAVAKVPWGHITHLLDKVRDDAERLWYVQKI